MAKPLNLPIILKKEQLVDNKRSLLKNLKYISPQPLYTEDVIYESSNGDFLRGDFHKVTIFNRYKLKTNSTAELLTVAKCETHDGYVIEKTSETITKLIGQSNYDLLFTTLWSVISQELKIRGILSLLTVSKKTNETPCQTDDSSSSLNSDIEISKVDISVQTDENILDIFKKKAPRKRAKRQHLSPYVVKDTTVYEKKVKRIVINPEDYKKKLLPLTSEDSDELKVDESKFNTDLPVIEGKLFDENSRDSITMPGLLNSVDQCTANTTKHPIHMLDSTVIYVPIKPENPYHVALKENLQSLAPNERRKLLFHQAYLDWKCCLAQDEDGNRPIHIAVLNNDLELLKRQCLVLKIRKETVDIAENLTALQMAISLDLPRCTEMLLQHGANPLLSNEEHKTALHLSAEANPGHLKAVINSCRINARKLLLEDKDLWEPRFENRSDQELGNHLLKHMSTMSDIQGYTPLMLASKVGKADNVKLLLESAPSSVNCQTPNSGCTALYLVVEAACIDASERGNKSKVSDNFSKTIELLVENGADPSIDNLFGSNINVLLTDFNIGELSMLIANKLTSINTGDLPSGNFNSYMLIKSEDGNVKRELIHEKPTRAKTSKKSVTVKDMVLSRPKAKRGGKTNASNNKPVIIQNLRISPDNNIKIDVLAADEFKTIIDKPVIVENVQVSKEGTGFINHFKEFVKESTYKQNVIEESSPKLLNTKTILHHSQIRTSPESKETIKIINNELIEEPLMIHFASKDRSTTVRDGPKRKIAITPGTSKKQKTNGK